MIDGRTVVAIIPARRGSKGLPLKNIKPLCGRPLLTWPIQAALKSSFVDRVVLSTDDPEFADVGRSAGADVPFLRPPELATDISASIDVILHALDELEALGNRYYYVVLLEPTSPLTESTDIDEALRTLVAHEDDAVAIVGVSATVSAHPSFAIRLDKLGFIQPYLSETFDQVPRRQDLEPLYHFDGSLYISTVTALRQERSFYHKKTVYYLTPRWKSFEVDDIVDFICVEAIVKQRAVFGPKDS